MLHRILACSFSVFAFLMGQSASAGVVVTPVGTPGFVPVDFHQFSAPIGTATSGYFEFLETITSLLPPPNHEFNPQLGVGPGAPHEGPYDQELGEGVASNGYVEKSVFAASEYSAGAGVYLVFMLVPGPGSPFGSSPDFISGPILPNSSFPLDVYGETFTNGVFNDIVAFGSVPAISEVTGFEALDGYSHIPYFVADNFDFASRRETGEFEYRLTLRDANGNGYDVTASFRVVPEPASIVLVSIAAVPFLWSVWRRNRRSRAKANPTLPA